MADTRDAPRLQLKGSAKWHQDQLQLKRIQSGFLGRIFGDNQSTPVHIAGVVLIALVIIGGAYTFYYGRFPKEGEPPNIGEFWKILSPMITGILGFIFGSRFPDRTQS